MPQDIRFMVLGQMRAYRGEAQLAVGSPQQQAMMVTLLLRRGRAVSVHEVIDAVWGQQSPETALATVRTYAWRWRKALEQDRAAPRVLVSVGDGYRLTLPPQNLDAHLAEDLAAKALRTGEDVSPEESSRLLLQALDLWRGEPLANIPGPFAEQQRSRLRELRLALLEERYELDLRLGRHALAIPDLNAFTAEHPLRERPYGLLMRALYTAGRQADSLGVFARLRQLLADELGVDPGPELRALHQQILSSDPALTAAIRPSTVLRAPERPTAEAAEQAWDGDQGGDPEDPAGRLAREFGATLTPAQLPMDTADFSGRTDALAELSQALTRTGNGSLPVAAVAGMGGVGKTALALRVAHRVKADFPDGQIYADLRGSEQEPTDPGLVLTSFLTALGLTAERIPESLEDRSRLYRSMLDSRRVLVLLDSARDAAQVRPLLPGSASCAVLITSRSRLFGLPTAVQVDLDVFDPDEALTLLGRIAGPDRAAADPAAALDLVTSCGRLPLAVRIVATRLATRPSWTVQTLSDRLADERRRLAELRIGDLAVDAVFELGYQQLTPDQASAFRLIAAVGGPDTGVPAAAAVLGMDESDAEDLLESLVDAAMLESSLPGRYRYHDLLRAFARQRAGEVGRRESLEALERLLDFLLATAAGAFQQVIPGDPVGNALGPKRTAGLPLRDLRTARSWVAIELEGALAVVLMAAQTAQAGDPAAAGRLRKAADLLIALSPFAQQVRYEQLVPVAQATAEAAEAVGDHRSVGRARFICGTVALQSTRLADAETQARMAADAARTVGDLVILRQALNDLGLVSQFQRRYQDALRHYAESVTLAREIGHRSGELVTLVNASLARVRCGRAAEAVPECEALLPTLQAMGDTRGVAYTLYVLGLAEHELGHHDKAVARYTQCLELCDAAGIRDRAAHAWYRLAETLRVTGRATEAVDYAELSLVRCEEIGAERDQAHALVVLGRALADLGRVEAAQLRLRQAHAVFARLGLPDAADVALLLDGLAPADVAGPSAERIGSR